MCEALPPTLETRNTGNTSARRETPAPETLNFMTVLRFKNGSFGVPDGSGRLLGSGMGSTEGLWRNLVDFGVPFWVLQGHRKSVQIDLGPIMGDSRTKLARKKGVPEAILKEGRFWTRAGAWEM